MHPLLEHGVFRWYRKATNVSASRDVAAWTTPLRQGVLVKQNLRADKHPMSKSLTNPRHHSAPDVLQARKNDVQLWFVWPTPKMPFTLAHPHEGFNTVVSQSTRPGATCSIGSSRASKAHSNLRLRSPPIMAEAKARTEPLFRTGCRLPSSWKAATNARRCAESPAAPVPTQIILMSMLLDHRTPGTIAGPFATLVTTFTFAFTGAILRKGSLSFHRHNR